MTPVSHDVPVRLMLAIADAKSTDFSGVADHRDAEVVERLYRAAIATDSTLNSRFAFSCYLEMHGRETEALLEFQTLLEFMKCVANKVFHARVLRHIVRLERRLTGNISLD